MNLNTRIRIEVEAQRRLCEYGTPEGVKKSWESRIRARRRAERHAAIRTLRGMARDMQQMKGKQV